MKGNTIDATRAAVKAFRDTREEAKRLAEGAKNQQPELIGALAGLGVTNEVGIVYDQDDKNKGAAYVQQNSGSEVWDIEQIISWLRKKSRRMMWLKCSSRTFDVMKWEAAIANGDVPTKIAKKFRTTTEPPQPFIRFGKIEDGSL